MRLRSPAVSRTSRGAIIWTVMVAGLCLLSATNASAALSGTYNASGSDTPNINLTGLTTGPFTVGGSGPSFCVGPPNACSSGSGVSGSTSVSGTQVAFTFFGSTNSNSGTFTINLINFTTPITGVTYVSGAFNNSPAATFTATGFTSSSLTFTGSTTGGFDALGGDTIIFDVTTAAAVPEPSSVVLFSTILVGIMFLGRRRFLGVRGSGQQRVSLISQCDRRRPCRRSHCLPLTFSADDPDGRVWREPDK